MLERVRSVRAHHEKELEQKFVGVREIPGIGEPQMPVSILPADLAELARPVRENTGKSGVRQIGGGCVAAAVEAASDGPPAVDAIFSGRVQAECVLRLERVESRQLIARAPEQLRTEQKILVNGAAQRFPAQRDVRSVEIGQEIGTKIRSEIAVASRIGDAEIEVGGFAEIPVTAEVSNDAEVLAAVG